MAKSLSVGIIGAGPGGLALGIFLKKAGFEHFTIFDREDGVGGTWRINTYPGLACDVKSHLYSYSFDLNADWSRLWSGQPEILAYFEECARRYHLAPHLRLNTEVAEVIWDEVTGAWTVRTTAGEVWSFDVVVSAVGLFTQPVMPELEEREPYTGTMMHTARWDHSVDLSGKRVAVLGTGSTASQVLPEIARVAARVYSVQRSPTWILPKPDRAYTDREKWMFAHLPLAKKFYRTRLWLQSESNIAVIENGSDKTQEFTAIAQHMLDSTVGDDALRARLTPDHPLGCKRLVFATDYLQSLSAPNVDVIASPASALKAGSLVTADGTELDVDVVVCATGYAAADYLGQIDVVGEDGARLDDVWHDGAYAYLGMAVPGFPNFFMLYGPNTNVGSNSVIFVLEAQARYIVRALRYMRRHRKSYLAVDRAATAEYLAKIDRWMVGTVWTTRCSSYFRAANGRVVTQWPRSARAFWSMTRRFRPRDYVLAPAADRRPIPVHAHGTGQQMADRVAESAVIQRLDPALRSLAQVRTDLSPGTLAGVRAGLDERRRDSASALDAGTVAISDTVVSVGSGRVIPVRVYRGVPGRSPAVVYFHSGAFVLGNLDTDHRQCVELSRQAECTVISVDYRLAPEHPFPAGFDDAKAVLDWVAADHGELGIDAARIALAGNSAGGAYAALLAQRCTDGSAPPVVFQLLHQPVIDDRPTPSKAEFMCTPGFDGAAAWQMWRHYIAGPAAPVDAVPARRVDLAGLPPAFISCSELDPLRDEALAYADRLKAAGVPTEVRRYPRTCHGFDSMIPECTVSQDLFSAQGSALRQALHGPG